MWFAVLLALTPQADSITTRYSENTVIAASSVSSRAAKAIRLIAAAATMFVAAAGISAWRVAGQAHWSSLALAWIPLLLVLGTLSYFLRFGRWHVLVRQLAPGLPARRSLRIYMSGYALGLTPARIGEFLKFSFLRDEAGVPEMLTAPIFPMERATEAVSCLAFAAGAATLGHLPLGHLSKAALVAAGLLPAAALLGIALRPFYRRLSSSGGPRGGMRDLVHGAVAIANPGPLTAAVSLALLARAFEALAFYAALEASGIAVSPAVAALASGLAGLAGGLSLLPAGISAVEGSLVALTVAFGAQVDLALAATFISRAATLWIWIPAGLWFAIRGKFGRA